MAVSFDFKIHFRAVITPEQIINALQGVIPGFLSVDADDFVVFSQACHKTWGIGPATGDRIFRFEYETVLEAFFRIINVYSIATTVTFLGFHLYQLTFPGHAVVLNIKAAFVEEKRIFEVGVFPEINLFLGIIEKYSKPPQNIAPDRTFPIGNQL